MRPFFMGFSLEAKPHQYNKLAYYDNFWLTACYDYAIARKLMRVQTMHAFANPLIRNTCSLLDDFPL